MKGLRLLNNGKWNKPPVLTAARQLFAIGLAKRFPQCALGKAASFVNGTSYDVDQVSTLAAFPIIRISNLTDPTSAYIRTDEDLGTKFWIRPGDLLVSWSASFKSALWCGPEGYLNQHIFKVTENSGFDRRYIRHIIEASLDAMQERVVGIGMMHLRRSDFLGHHVSAPPISIQTAVATYLDWIESGRIGVEPPLPSELAEQRRVVARIEELGRQNDEARSLRNQAAREAEALWWRGAEGVFATLAEDYPLRLLKEVVEIRGGGTPSKSNPLYWGGEIPWFSPKDMKVRQLFNAIDHISKRATTESAAKLIGPGAVLVVVRGMILAHTFPSAVLCVSAAINQDMKALVPTTQILPEFLCAFFWAENSRYLDIVEKSTHDTRKLETAKLLATSIPVPPLTVQRRIVDELEGLRIKVDVLRQLQSVTTTELNALLPAILDRAFKGELV
jgi:type I restriction enzyme S subunit